MEYYRQGEARKMDHRTDLMPISRSDISSYSAPAAPIPGIRQLNLGPNSDQANVLRLGLDWLAITGVWDCISDCCAWRRQGDGVICRLPSVFLEITLILGLEALTTNFTARNISSTCNSSGSALWASTMNIKPLVDANYYKEVIEFAYHQSPFRFSPTHYQNPGSKSRSPNGQIMLFGCPLELRTVEELNKIPPVLEYLLDSVHDWPRTYSWPLPVGQKSEIVQLAHSFVRWRNSGLWLMSLNKHGRVWRKTIVLLFQISSCKTNTDYSFWFVHLRYTI